MSLRQRREIEMGLRTVKLRRLLGATALCGGRGALGSATARPSCLGATPAAADVGAAATTDVGAAVSATACLYPIPSLLTDR
jgi:hypothetical protein